MRVRLMHPLEDFATSHPLPAHAPDVTADLGLATVWDAMAAGDARVLEVARAATFAPPDPTSVGWRQDVLAELRAEPETADALYALASGAVDAERRVWRSMRRTPSSTLNRSRQVLELFVASLRSLRGLVDEHAGTWRSAGLRGLAEVVRHDLDDAYFAEVGQHLDALRLRDGLWLSARLGEGNRGTGYVLRRPPDRRGWWREALHLAPPSLGFDVHPRDEAGVEALGELGDRGLNLVANALAQSADHVLAFFTQLRDETAFYVGCLRLEGALAATGSPACRARLVPPGPSPVLDATGLYDGALALRTGSAVVRNDLRADGRALVMVTGANSGGKSTFLRSVGLAQLMAQAGMPVCATSFGASVSTGVFTHFAREEDETMQSGRFDEELARMSAIAERIGPGGIALFNESFAGTSEREGSEVARHVVRALVESKVRVLFVTHLYDLARSLYDETGDAGLFLRAERLEDGERTYRILEGAPLATSFGADLYERLGGFAP